MKIKIIRRMLTLAAALFALSCNEEPTQMGSALISDTLALYPLSSKTSPVITENKIIKKRATGFVSGTLFIGSYKNTAAFSYVRYGNLPDTLDYLSGADIISSTLTLYPERYALGDTAANSQAFNIYELKKPFYLTTNYDTVKAQGGLNSWFNRQVGDFSGSIPLMDKMDPVTIDISKDMIADWFKFAATGDTNSYSHSLALVPQPGSSVINRFKSSELGNLSNSPLINIKYRNKSGGEDSLLLKALVTNYYADAPQPDESDFVIQGGIVYRTELHLDLSEIPEFSSIHKAQLEVYLNRGASTFGNMGADSVLTIVYPLKAGNADSLVTYHARLEPGDKYVFPSISSAIESIVSKGGKGYLTFQAARSGVTSNEYKYLDRAVFYGMNAPENKKPVLKIIYSKRPQIKPE